MTYTNKDIFHKIESLDFFGYVLSEKAQPNYKIRYEHFDRIIIFGLGSSFPNPLDLEKEKEGANYWQKDYEIFRLLDPRFVLNSMETQEVKEGTLLGHYSIEGLKIKHFDFFKKNNMIRRWVKFELNESWLPKLMVQEDVPEPERALIIAFDYSRN